MQYAWEGGYLAGGNEKAAGLGRLVEGDYGCVANVINAASARNHHASWHCLRCKYAEPTYSDKQIDVAADTALIISYILPLLSLFILVTILPHRDYKAAWYAAISAGE